jgi:hypothetical protein
MEKYDTGLITGSPAAALENVQAMFPKKRALDSSGTKFDPASDPRSIREEVIDRARQAKRPEPLGDVGADDLAPTMADRIPDYAGPSLSERKAKASEKLGDDPILKNLRLELDGLRLEEDRFKSVVSRAAAAGQPKSKLETDDQLRKMKAAIDAKELEVKEREYFLKAAQPRAGGGPVSAGKPYMVGEAGKELFVPGESGQVVPNSSLADFRDRFADFQIRRALTGIDRDASAKRTFLNLNTGRSRGSRRARGKSQGDFGEPSGGGTSGELEQPFLKVEPDQGFTPPKSFLTGGGPPPPGSPAAAAAAKAEGASLGPKLDAILTAIQQTNGFLSALQLRSVLRNAMLT